MQDGYFTCVEFTQALKRNSMYKESSESCEDGVDRAFAEKFLKTLDALAEAIDILEDAGWPSTFLVVYDEVWILQQLVQPLMTGACGNLPNMDILALKIDPSRGTAGFSPHRDRQPSDVAGSFRSDGSPKYTTCWLALSDATPENSCLYVIPRPFDPGYSVGDGTGPADDMMRDALATKESYQNIRGLPLQQGEALFFSHRTIHWGSRGHPACQYPRKALSFAFSDEVFEPPYIHLQGYQQRKGTTAGTKTDAVDSDVKYSVVPSVPVRLALAASQMLVYHERFNPGLEKLSLYGALFKATLGDLQPEYRKKVQVEFVSAVRDAEAQERASSAHKNADERGTEGGTVGGTSSRVACDDVLDDALDSMLDAVCDGYDGFDDDFNDSDDGGAMEGAEVGNPTSGACSTDEESDAPQKKPRLCT